MLGGKKVGIVFSLILLISVLSSVIIVAGTPEIKPYYERPCGDIDDVDICDWTLESSQYPDLGLPLGSTDISQCGIDYNTWWDVGSNPDPSFATATCIFDSSQLEDAMLYISINNDIVECTLNEVEVFGSEIHEGCAPEDPRDGFSADIYGEVLEGSNTLICELKDRGAMSHFDACVVGEFYDDYNCPLVEVIVPPDTDPITWYAGTITAKGTVSDSDSGTKEARVIFHDDFPKTWDDGFFDMIYNSGSGFWEYDWDSLNAEINNDCSIVHVDIFGEDNAGEY